MDWFQWMTANRVSLVPVLATKPGSGKRASVAILHWCAGRKQIVASNNRQNIVQMSYLCEGATPELALQTLKDKLDTEAPVPDKC